MMKAQQEAGSAPRITPKVVDWILYNMPVLRDQIEAIEPRTSTGVRTERQGWGRVRIGG